MLRVGWGLGCLSAALSCSDSCRQSVNAKRGPRDSGPQVYCDSGQKRGKETIHVKGSNPVIVIGGGVAGITTAHALIQRNYDVTLIDSNSNIGTQASAAAAGSLLRANHALGAYDWAQVIKNMVPNNPYRHFEEFLVMRFTFPFAHLLGMGVDEASERRAGRDFKFFKVRWTRVIFDAHYYRWLMRFMKQTIWPSSEVKANNQEMLKFSDWAISKMCSTIDDEKIECAYSDDHLVNVYESERGFKKAQRERDVLVLPEKKFWNVDEMKDAVPSVQFSQLKFHGASYMRCEMADCHMFTVGLGNKLREKVNFMMNKRVTGFTTTKNDKNELTITSIHTCNEVIKATQPDGSPIPVVIATGAWLPHLCARLGYYVPVYPIKGYDLLVDIGEALQDEKLAKYIPKGILTDSRLFIVRVGDRLRIASIGELGGWSVFPENDMYASMRGRAIVLLPHLRNEISGAHFLSGLRPVVNDGRLLAGLLPKSTNAFVTSGPGFNGWKTSMGSAELLAMSIDAVRSGREVEEVMKGSQLPFDGGLVLPEGRVKYSPLFCKACVMGWDLVASRRH